MNIKLDSRTPVYLQVIRYFKERIASGKLKMGEVIPSRRELAAKLNINPNTVQRAYKEMEEAGLIYTDGNMPSKVTRDEQTIIQVRNELVSDALQQFVQTLRTLNIPLSDIYPLLEESYAATDQIQHEQHEKLHTTTTEQLKKETGKIDEQAQKRTGITNEQKNHTDSIGGNNGD